MAAKPMPVIVLSSMGAEGGPVALEALEAGALEVVCKPGASYTVAETCDQMAEIIFSTFRGGVRRPSPTTNISRPTAASIPRVRSNSKAMTQTTQKILAIGASTGGVQSLTKVFTALPATSPGIVVVQHMPPRFTTMFAQRLNETCAMRVKEAEHGDRVVNGQILIAPGGKHMTLTRSGAVYSVELNEGPMVCLQRPSVDVLFRSVAQYAGPNAIGALLTGMGADGAAGLLEMRNQGAKTIAQDEETCIVFGMPREAIKLNAAELILPLDAIGPKMLKLVDAIS
jgi:two-component system chemotaxis response regulator CheB